SFFYATSTTEYYTLSLHDALPICSLTPGRTLWMKSASTAVKYWTMLLTLRRTMETVISTQDTFSLSVVRMIFPRRLGLPLAVKRDRKSTRLNSSHVAISYAVFCLK